LIDAAVVAQLHVSGVYNLSHITATDTVVGHILQLLLIVSLGIMHVFYCLDLFYGGELNSVTVRYLLTARLISSSLDRVLFPLRYSPLIISLSSGNFFVGSTFFLSTDLPFCFCKFLVNDLL